MHIPRRDRQHGSSPGAVPGLPGAAAATLALLSVAILASGCEDSTAPAEPVALTLEPRSATIAVDSVLELGAFLEDAEGERRPAASASWASSDTAVATVDPDGMVRGVTTGLTTITVSASGFRDSAAVTVISRVARIELSLDSVHIVRSGVVDLDATVVDHDGRTVERRLAWRSLDPSVATVGVDGRVTGVGPGRAAIVVSLDDGVARAVVVVELIDFAALSLGSGHNCGLTTTGRAYCWGRSALGSTAFASSHTPVPVAGDLTFSRIDAGPFHTCALTADGTAYCWGANGAGELGIGSRESSSVPVRVAGGLKFSVISAGGGFGGFTCGVTLEGDAFCWGNNDFGKLGTGDTADRLSPAAVTGGLEFVEISVGNNHVCGITMSGAAYCWGRNRYGQLGNGEDTGESHVPVRAAVGLEFSAIMAAAHDYTCAITRTDQQLYCWGHNDTAQLGLGTETTEELQPVPTPGLPRVVAVHGYIFHTCAAAVDGSALCWGEFAGSGSLGDGEFRSSLVPVRVEGGLDFVDVSTGGNRSCGVTPDNVAYCWGWDLAAGFNGVPVRVPGQR